MNSRSPIAGVPRNWASSESNLQIRNLFWLLQLEDVRRALAISSQPEAAADLLRFAILPDRIDSSRVLSANGAGADYDLIFVFDMEIGIGATVHANSQNMVSLARIAFQLLAPGGALVIVEPNPAWFRTLLRTRAKLPSVFFDAFPPVVSRRLASMGYSPVQVFLIDPAHTHPKVIVPARSKAVATHLRSERDRSSGQAIPAKLVISLLGGSGLLYPARAIFAKK